MEQIQIKKEMQKNPCCVGLWHAIAGILMILLGIYVVANPIVSLVALGLYIGLALIVIGAGYIGSSFRNDSGWFMFVGLIDIIIGLILVADIGVTTMTLPIIFAIWCLAVGAAQILSAYRYARSGLPWIWSGLLGLSGLVFGLLILQYPNFGIVTIALLMGAYILLYGMLEILEYIYFRKHNPLA